jgi:SAM-dependent methyltransferase
MLLNVEDFLRSNFEGRVHLVNQAYGASLWSSQLAPIWRDIILKLENADGRNHTIGRLTRELLVLAPDSTAAEDAYRHWMRHDGLRGSIPDPPIVYLIISCEKYKQRALPLYDKIVPRLSPTFIVLGDETIGEAAFSERFLTVPAQDNYEGLPKKILESLLAVRREFGKVGVLKMDDDDDFFAEPDCTKIRELVASADYAGRRVGNPELDRRFHIGKSEYLNEPYGKRYRGHWAKGALYYLGPKAVDILVRDYMSFPGEFVAEIWEDKMVGDFLNVHRVTLTDVSLPEIFGINYPADGWFNPPKLSEPLTIDWQGGSPTTGFRMDAVGSPDGHGHADLSKRDDALSRAEPLPRKPVRFGDLRRVTPISREFGFDRGKPLDRRYIEEFLSQYAEDIRGQVLEVADNAYTARFGGDRVQRSDILHGDFGNPRATLVGDLGADKHFPSSEYDCIVLTQTLQYVFELQTAVATLHRMLKPGGVLLVTVPGVSSIDTGRWGPNWYWSLSVNALRRLLEGAFGGTNIGVSGYGNVLASIAFLHGLAESELGPSELDTTDPQYPVIVAGRALKV